MTEATLKKYKNEVESTIGSIKITRKIPPHFDLQKYIGTHFHVTGLSMPQLRQAFKKGYSFSNLSVEEQFEIYQYIFFHSEIFDVMLQPLFFCEKYVKINPPRKVWLQLKEWMPKIDNWAHSDMLTQHFAYLLELSPTLIYKELIKWNKSDNPWYRRQSVLSLLGYARFREVKPDFEKIITLIKPLLGDENYYVQKGVGWCLRETGIVYPQPTLQFLLEYHSYISPTAFSTATEKLAGNEKEKLKLLRKAARRR